MQTHQVKHVTCKHIMSSTHACISPGHAYVGKLTPMYHSYLVCPGMRLSLAVAMSLQRNVRMRPDIASGKDRRIAVWSTQALHTDALVKGRDREGAMHGACRGAHDASSMSDRFGAALVLSLEAGMIVCSLTWSSDESILVAAGWRDNTARAWYIPSGMQVPPLAPLRRPICAVEWLAGHWLCAGGGGDEVILLWNLEPGGPASGQDSPPDPVARVRAGRGWGRGGV